MKKTTALVLALLLFAGVVIAGWVVESKRHNYQKSPNAQVQAHEEATVSVHFSPKGGCTDEVVKQLSAANTEVLVQAYSFTSQPIVDALVAAHKRGVDVMVILDKSDISGKGSLEHPIVKAGIPTWIDRKHAIAHNKIMVIDGKTVLTGSFNFTTAAEEHNAENLLTVHSLEIAKIYAQNWKMHQGHSDKAIK